VNKSMANLSQLESTSTKRKAEDFPLGKLPRKSSPPPKKIVKSKAYVDDSDEISLNWGSDLDEEIGEAAGLLTKSCKSLKFPQILSVSNDLQLPQMLEVDSWSFPLYKFSNTLTSALSGLRVIEKKLQKHREECKTCKHHDSGEWIMDSGASLYFTGFEEDFSAIEYGDFGETETANGITKITAKGTVFIKHLIELEDGSEYEKVSKLEPVFYLPKLSVRLMSMGTLLQQGLEVIGSSSRMIFRDKSTNKVEMTCTPHHDGQTIYWVKSKILKPKHAMANIKLDELHRRMGHPSEEVLKHMPRQTKGFDKLIMPKERSVCPGCAQGKMHSKPYPESQKRATKIFEIIHSDLKEFPVVSYHGFKYYMSFLDDYSSHAWVIKLKKKSDAYDAFIKWIALVQNQFKDECHIKTWHCDGGGEYINKKFIKKFEELGINWTQSAPHTPQQNGRAERFNRTLMDKAESMRHLAGLPGSWWEFAVDHGVHIYNRTPMRRLEWRTPYEPIYHEKPDISYI
jgi:transposase InsO family protein